jgi:hypothetical protein
MRSTRPTVLAITTWMAMKNARLRGTAKNNSPKEFVREWLMAHGFQGLEDQMMPVMPGAFVEQVSETVY